MSGRDVPYPKVLMRKVARAAEQAYRRGFQQGFTLATHPETGRYVPSDLELHDWRYGKSLNRTYCPPGTRATPFLDRQTSVERLLMESTEWVEGVNEEENR